MHPYAEYLHDYILKQNGYADTGKPASDFRLTFYGSFLRRYWLDELPQLINVLKGEMKLVGVRPVSTRYFQDIPEDLRALRLKHKPGCIPPYVALDRKGAKDDVIQAEREYLLMKEKSPYWTDTILFFKAIFNIIFKRKRSA
jgi:lipopolysaccharide/colanic/teichoic acid biosynthesis glycosyltransferase